MNKGQIIGLTVTALAVVGGIAVFNWVRKPKPNREGFFNVAGKFDKFSSGGVGTGVGNCRTCRTSTGASYTAGYNNRCNEGDKCVQSL